VLVGGFASILRDPINSNTPILFDNVVSQLTINMVASNTDIAAQGGIYAIAYPKALFIQYIAPSPNVVYVNFDQNNTALVGFRSDLDPTSGKRTLPIQYWFGNLTDEQCGVYFSQQDNSFIQGQCWDYYISIAINQQRCCAIKFFDPCVYACIHQTGNSANVIDKICYECTVSKRDAKKKGDKPNAKRDDFPRMYPLSCVNQYNQ